MDRVFPYFLLSVLLVVPGGIGLYYLIMNTQPNLLQRWLFYLLVFLVICGIALPTSALLNRYFFTLRRINAKTVTREACGCGVMADVLIWFRIGRVLSTSIVFILVGGLLFVELLLRARDAVEFRSGIDDIEDEN